MNDEQIHEARRKLAKMRLRYEANESRRVRAVRGGSNGTERTPGQQILDTMRWHEKLAAWDLRRWAQREGIQVLNQMLANILGSRWTSISGVILILISAWAEAEHMKVVNFLSPTGDDLLMQIALALGGGVLIAARDPRAAP